MRTIDPVRREEALRLRLLAESPLTAAELAARWGIAEKSARHFLERVRRTLTEEELRAVAEVAGRAASARVLRSLPAADHDAAPRALLCAPSGATMEELRETGAMGWRTRAGARDSLARLGATSEPIREDDPRRGRGVRALAWRLRVP